MNEKQTMKVDVTSQIDGKLENGNIGLYLDNARVGEIALNESGQNEYAMSEDYAFEGDKVYRLENPSPEKETKYVDGCDQGWC